MASESHEALVESLAEVSRSMERYQAIFEFAGEAMLLMAEKGILDCNRAMIEMLRCRDKAEVLALHPAVLSPEFQPDGRRSRDRAGENDRIVREKGTHRFVWMHRRMTGEDFPVQVCLARVMLHSGPVLLCTWYDLTELQRHESTLRAQATVVAQQEEMIRRLSTPVIRVGAGVLLVPVVGAIDERRAAQMTEMVLHALAEQRARTVIVDLTGVEEFDAATVEHLVRLAGATRLLGAEAVLAGIGPAVARTIVACDADLRHVRTTASAGEAIARALARG